eukprot:924108-Prymnesium_polylepis.2
MRDAHGEVERDAAGAVAPARGSRCRAPLGASSVFLAQSAKIVEIRPDVGDTHACMTLQDLVSLREGERRALAELVHLEQVEVC